jgi:hypothetical protein
MYRNNVDLTHFLTMIKLKNYKENFPMINGHVFLTAKLLIEV